MFELYTITLPVFVFLDFLFVFCVVFCSSLFTSFFFGQLYMLFYSAEGVTSLVQTYVGNIVSISYRFPRR